MAAPMERGEPGVEQKSTLKRSDKRRKWWKEHKKQVNSTRETETDSSVPKAKTESNTFTKILNKKSKSGFTFHKEKTEAQNTESDDSQTSVDSDDSMTDSNSDSDSESSKDHENKPDEEKTNTECIKLRTDLESENKQSIGKSSGKKRKGYVLFIGNLPFDVTKEDIEKHFIRTGGVKAVRLLSDKSTGKSRGFGYVEFKDEQSFKFGLRFHHTKLNGRTINVEFTSVGGSTSKRKEKLKKKNAALGKFKYNRNAGKQKRAKKFRKFKGRKKT